MGALRFAKYEGLGNDFLVVDADDETVVPSSLASALCDRRRGVGGDGVLMVLPATSTDAVARMRVVNADGSVPEMCGNGLRCVALHVARTRASVPARFVIDTDAGPKTCEMSELTSDRATVRVDMGIVSVVGSRDITIGGRVFSLTLADAGNPHAITTQPFDRADVDRFGPPLATHASFPAGTNVEFVDLVSPTSANVVVYERGVGITLACGTGACATARAMVAAGRMPAETELTVTLLGGPLSIRVENDGRVFMRGPARLSFEGSLDTRAYSATERTSHG